MALPHGAVGWSAAYDSYISWSFSFTDRLHQIILEIAAALQELCNRCCMREHVQFSALNTWKYLETRLKIVLIKEIHYFIFINLNGYF